MNCPKCGKEIGDNQKFCTYCGTQISEVTTKTCNKKIIIISALTICCLLVAGTVVGFVINNNSKQTNEQIEVVQEEVAKPKSPAEILSEINSYQARYFEIVKRNNALLDISGDETAQRDLKELNNLFKEVENKIDSKNEYYIQYKTIQEKFSSNPGETTVEMNDFAKQNYDAIDKLLNDVYKAVKQKISQEDFENLKITQRAWLKEVMAYNKVFEAQGFGTIGTIVGLNYEIDMRSFRTLLLMLYLTEPVQIQTEQNIDSYKSIAPIKDSIIEEMSVDNIINLMIEEDKDLTEYLNNYQNKNFDSIFTTFWKSITSLCDIVNGDESETVESLTLPSNTNLLIIDNGIALINLEYIENKYLKYLNKDWNEYIKLLKKYNIDRKNDLSENEIINWIVIWQDFIKQHPNFSSKRQIRHDIRSLTDEILEYNNYTYYEDGEHLDIKKLNKVYDELLNKVDKNSLEYKFAYKTYKELKDNNYIKSAKYHQYFYEYWGSPYHEYEYKVLSGELERGEDEEQYYEDRGRSKIIDKFNDIEYDRNKMSEMYKEAYKYCEKHELDKDKEGNYINGGTGYYEGCISDYISHNHPEYNAILNGISLYCSELYDSEVSIRNCLHENMK